MNLKTYRKEMLMIGLPITLQCIFQASYSLIDQLMVGTLGTVSVAGSGLGAKFSSLAIFTLSSVAAVASILIAQYHGKGDEKGINLSLFSCSYLAILVMLCFALPAYFLPEAIIKIYTADPQTVKVAAGFLKILAISFCPMTVTLLLSSFFRSIEQSRYPMYASVIAIFANIFFNYLLIFGKFGQPKMGLRGAALGTLIARTMEAALLLFWMAQKSVKREIYIRPVSIWNKEFYKRISVIVFPILLNEFSWSLGENIYAAIYGRLGTDALAAMTLTNPIQGMFIGMFSGLSSAAVVMVGKRLGNHEKEEALAISKYLMKIGLAGSLLIGLLLALLIPFYVQMFQVEREVKQLTIYIVYALAIVLFAKISNMILGGGILRSGGDTHYTLISDLIGTWLVGVPLGLLTAFVLHLPIYQVYFILSLEEVVRVLIGLFIFYRNKWMKDITS